MSVKIRLMRIGSRKRPFYRVVAVDERAKRTGAYLELLGTYNPLTEPKEIKLSQEKIDAWKKKGAIMSDGFLRIIGQAKPRLPRKAKKERNEKEVKSVVEEAKKEETSNQSTEVDTEDMTNEPVLDEHPQGEIVEEVLDEASLEAKQVKASEVEESKS